MEVLLRYQEDNALALDIMRLIKTSGVFEFLTRSHTDSTLEDKSKKTKATITNPLIQELDSIKAEYTDNWDDEGAKAITDDVYNNCKAVFEKGEDLISDRWWMAPKTNGTLLLISNNDHANIQIGNSTISYFIECPNKECIEESSVDFSVDKVLDIIKKANEYDC